MRAGQMREGASATTPLAAGPDQMLHVHFGRAPQDQVVGAFEALRQVIADHPGDTGVVLHIPAGSGREQEMQLRIGVAYDANMLADVQRRLGGLVTLSLG